MRHVYLNGDGMVNLKTENFTQGETHDFRLFWTKQMSQVDLNKFLVVNDVSLVDNRIVDNIDGYEYGFIK